MSRFSLLPVTAQRYLDVGQSKSSLDQANLGLILKNQALGTVRISLGHTRPANPASASPFTNFVAVHLIIRHDVRPAGSAMLMEDPTPVYRRKQHAQGALHTQEKLQFEFMQILQSEWQDDLSWVAQSNQEEGDPYEPIIRAGIAGFY